MAEPTSTAAGASLAVLSVAIFGPLAGPWALICTSALAGSMWPLFASTTPSRWHGAWLVLRCTTTALFLTSFIAGLLEIQFGIPVSELLAPVALAIAALGNGWGPVFAGLGHILNGFLSKHGVRKDG